MLKLPDSEKSFWREFYTEPIYPQLTTNLAVDVAVIGAGISGLTTAYLLKQSGLSVAVLEKSTVGSGTSGRTTGKVTSQHNLCYSGMQEHLGKQVARIYGEANQAALEQVEAIIKSRSIVCDWRRQDNYVFSDNKDQLGLLKQEAKVAASLGLPASFVDDTPLPFGVQGAVKFNNQASINSQKYLLGLARSVDGDGCHVFEHSSVNSIREGEPGHVRTNKATVTAHQIVVATNVPTLPLAARGSYCLLEYPTESYIVAGQLNSELSGMYISPDKNHYSILPVPGLVNGERYLLIGGEGHISGLRGNKKARYQRLADYAEKKFGITAISHHWSDRDYLAYDGVPLIGHLYPWSKNLYVATAMKKWGLSNGTVAGMILHDLITDKPNPWASTFDSSRFKPIQSIPRVAAKYITGND